MVYPLGGGPARVPARAPLAFTLGGRPAASAGGSCLLVGAACGETNALASGGSAVVYPLGGGPARVPARVPLVFTLGGRPSYGDSAGADRVWGLNKGCVVCELEEK